MSAPHPLDGGRFVSTVGGDVYVREWGNKSGPAVVMIHGTTSHLQEFEVSLGPTLESKYHLVAYDRPGMGRSQLRTANADRLDIQAGTTADVIAQLGLDKPVVIGHSYGGAVALRLALDHPDKVSGLVLLAPASHPWGGGAPFFFDILAAPVSGEIVTHLTWPFSKTAAMNSFVTRVFKPEKMPEGYYEKAEVKLAMRPHAVKNSSKDFVKLPKELEKQAPRYGELKMPIAIIAGKNDQIVPVDLEKKGGSAFAVTKLDVLPGVGHMPQHARPDLVEEDIRWVLEKAR